MEKTEEMKPIQTVANVSPINNLAYPSHACNYLAFTGEMEDYEIPSEYDIGYSEFTPSNEICKLRCQERKSCAAYTFDKANYLCVLKGAKESSRDTKVGIVT